MFLFHIAKWIGDSYKKKWPEKNLDDTSAQFLGCFTVIAFLIPVSLFVSGIIWTVEIIVSLSVTFDFFMLCKGIFSSLLVLFSALLCTAGIYFIYNYGETIGEVKNVTPAIVIEKRRELNKKRIYCVCGEHIKPGQNFCITCGISLN
jgi:hypothetical protein